KKCSGLWSPPSSLQQGTQGHFARLTALCLLHTETSNAISKRLVLSLESEGC
ncbi:unnamed protein product, partial [Ectocarpus sp. 8 AP-2014]